MNCGASSGLPGLGIAPFGWTGTLGVMTVSTSMNGSPGGRMGA